jgi:hypothetical protein
MSFEDIMSKDVRKKIEVALAKITDREAVSGRKGFNYIDENERMVRFIPSSAYLPYPYGMETTNNQERGMMRAEDRIICPVCGNSVSQCSWFLEVIRKGNANEVFVDMLQGMFRGDNAYIQGMDQQAYYDRTRQEFYRKKAQGKPSDMFNGTWEEMDATIKGRKKTIKSKSRLIENNASKNSKR